MDCIFCKIANKEMSADICYEDEEFIVFKNIRPTAPIHLLIVPKEHIPSVEELKPEHTQLIGRMFLIAQRTAREQGIAKKGYKLVFNVGKGGGQIIEHLHLHLLGGWQSEKERDIPGMP